MDNEDKGLSQEAANIVKSVAVPLYQDAFSPAAKQLGQSLETIAKAINVALAPIGALVWGYEQIQEFVKTRVAEKLKDVPPERIQTPNPHVVGPTLEALRYTGSDPELSELFANLLATTLDSKTAHKAHPSFVDIIKQLTSDEAKILSFFQPYVSIPLVDIYIQVDKAKPGIIRVPYRNISLIGIYAECRYPDLTPSYIENLCRLGLADIPFMTTMEKEHSYNDLENHDIVTVKMEECKSGTSGVVKIEKKIFAKTEWGRQFDAACVPFSKAPENVLNKK